jgi:serine/threonine protein kinase
MIITNFNEQTANSGATEIIAGFYVMPKYSLNLE